MAMAKKGEPSDHLAQHERDTQYRLVREQILQILGTPPNLINVQVRMLWENHFRVNVFVGPDAATANVANSYFLEVDGEGNITTCVPEITKQY